MGISTMGTPIIESSILGTLIMDVLIEDVSIISLCTIGSHAHYEYIYNGYVQIAHRAHYGCV